MDEIHYLLEIAKDLLEILVLILTARQLTKKKKHKNLRRNLSKSLTASKTGIMFPLAVRVQMPHICIQIC